MESWLKCCLAKPIFLALVFIAGLLAQPAFGQGGASKEKCTCTLEGRYDPTGAQVVNAGVCERDRIGQWCDIYLVATAASARHDFILASLGEVTQSGDSEALADLLKGLVREYVASQEDGPGHERIRVNESYLTSATDRAAPQLQTCISAFLVGEPVSTEGDGFMCRVGPQSGWLEVSFQIEDGLFSFLFAPNW